MYWRNSEDTDSRYWTRKIVWNQKVGTTNGIYDGLYANDIGCKSRN